MGCCLGASAAADGGPDPQTVEVSLPDNSRLRVGLASPGLVFSILATHGDGAVLVDSQSRAAFNEAHLFGAWGLGGDAGGGGERGSTIKSRCSLRTVVVYGGSNDALRDG